MFTPQSLIILSRYIKDLSGEKEMEKLELFSSRPAMVIEAIKDLHEKEMNRLSKKLKKKTTDDD